MRRLALAPLFAAALAAQQAQPPVPAPPPELAAILAVEEQEGDLAKAERFYREALAGNRLSADAQREAQQRLGRLLQKLGRADEARAFLQAAKGGVVSLDDVTDEFEAQDAARHAALREQAQKLLATVRAGAAAAHARGASCLTERQLEQLRWLGQPVVPVVIAELEGLRGRAGEMGTYLSDLAGFLWWIGGPQAMDFLLAASRSEAYGDRIARAAHQLRDPGLLIVAERFLGHADMDVVRSLLRSHGGNQPALEFRLPETALLALGETGDADRLALVLDWAMRRDLGSPANSRRLVALVRKGLASTDPGVGTAAVACLLHRNLQRCLDGFDLLLEQLPGLRLSLRHWGLPEDAVDGEGQATDATCARLWPRAIAVARTLDEAHPARGWIQALLGDLVLRLDDDPTADLLDLVDRGHDVLFLLADRVRPDNAVAILARIATWDQLHGPGFLRSFARTELPPEAAQKLIQLADEGLRHSTFLSDQRGPWLCGALANTGDPAALAWLRARVGRQPNPTVVRGIAQFARRSNDAAGRDALRALLRTPQQQPPQLGQHQQQWSPLQTEVLLALLALRDESALESIQGNETRVEHPFAPDEPQTTPLWYLLRTHAKPPHGFDLAAKERVLRRLAPNRGSLSPFLFDDYDDATVRLLAEFHHTSYSDNAGQSRSWMQIAFARGRAQAGGNGWREWQDRMLAAAAAPVQYYALAALDADEVRARLPQIEAILAAGGDGATAAADALLRAGRDVDLVALLQSPHAPLRNWAFWRVVRGESRAPASALVPFLAAESSWQRLQAAKHFAAQLDLAAVPGLIALLRDGDENVREAASTALTRIRFYHEQQAHWDRVLAGLDASPASAMEKLLLQAKPDAPRPQRLLAIPSLGALGLPEALPFLIDWSTDADAEIAAAAKAAITRIHLEPRR